MRKNVVLIPLLLLLSCYDNTEVLQPQPEPGLHVIKPDEHPQLMQAFDNLVIPQRKSNGRVKSSLGEIYTDEALMRVNEEHEITNYSFEVESDAYELKNLVIEESENGFNAYILHHIPDADWLISNPDASWDMFTGLVKAIDLDGNLLFEIAVENGQNVQASNGKINNMCFFKEWKVEVRTPFGVSTYYETELIGCVSSGGSGGGGGASGGGGGTGGGGGGSGTPGGGKPKVTGKMGIVDKKKEDREKELNKRLEKVRDSVYIKLKNPCLANMITKVVYTNLDNNIAHIINQVFENQENIHLSFYEVNDLPNSTLGQAIVGPVTSGNNIAIQADIFLNLNVLPQASQEMIVSTIIHEVLHAYLGYTRSSDKFNDHEEMANEYILFMKNTLTKIFPKLSPITAEHLAWGGLQETNAWQELENNNQTLANEIIQTNIKHAKGTNERSVNNLNLFLILFFLIPKISFCQSEEKTLNVVRKQIAQPIQNLIRTYLNERDKDKTKCDVIVFTTKFIVNTNSLTCDTIIVSKRINQAFASRLTDTLMTSKINWKTILHDIDYTNKEKLELLFAVYATSDICKEKNLYNSDWWDIINELFIKDNKEVIILGSMNMSLVR